MKGLDSKLSIIVPIYKGKAYISGIIEQAELNYANSNCQIELIFVNDFPEEPLEDYDSSKVDIVTVQTDINRGIHGARVEGLKYAHGEYVLFLDQDDYIYPEYVSAQLSTIGQADAVVCRALHGKQLLYNNSKKFENVVSKQYMSNTGNGILSPGQVLIRRSSIPEIWTETIINNNGADDYFLWLIMMAQNELFVLNQKVLFEHNLNGKNTSNDVYKMICSEKEMIEVLQRNRLYSSEQLDHLFVSLMNLHIKEFDVYRKSFDVVKNWMNRTANGINPFHELNSQGINKIGIYGAGRLGRWLRDCLSFSGLEVVCYVDQNAEYIVSDIPVFHIEKFDMNIDLLIVSVIDENRKLKDEIKKVYNGKVEYIDELLENQNLF